MADDYSPVLAPDDEEEQKKKWQGIPYDYSPVPSAPATEPAPTSAGKWQSVTQPPPDLPLEQPQGPKRPEWKDYAPAERHGWGKFGSIMASLNPIANDIVNQRPLRNAERNYQGATSDYDKNFQEQSEAPLRAAQTHEAEARAKSLENPPDKVGQTPEEQTLHDLMTGENGQPRVNPKTGKPFSYLEAYEATKQAAQDVKPEGKPDSPEQQFLDEYQRTHQGATLADAVKAYAAATQKPERAGADDARVERSYQATVGRFDKLRKPVEDRAERIARLEDTLNQGTPQADALIAPELLTVMAGGQGSGLRMNEAEIARIIGGRTNWEALKAAIGKWQMNPSEGFAITPAQREQVRALFGAIKERVNHKMQAIDEESQNLADENDPKEHRQIYNRLQHRLSEIDTGQGEATVKMKAPNGNIKNVPADQVGHYKSLGAVPVAP
jgi:hypothetical protein